LPDESLSAGKKKQARSRLTNGKQLFLDRIDGRTAEARRLGDLIAQHTADLGGESEISEAERRLIRRAAALTLQCELLELKWHLHDGATVKDLELYNRTSNTLRRLLESLGLQRRQRDVTPDLKSYINGKAVAQ
jgi:hypothetical protein